MYPRQTPLFRLILSVFAASILSVFTVITLTFFSGTTVIHAQSGSISGRVWDDANTNGVVDAGEAGIPDATVVLYDVTLGTCRSVHTGNDGSYSFSGLNSGDYRIYEAAGESTPVPAICPPTESVADPNTKTVTPGSIADPDNHLSSTPNRIDVTLNGDLTDQNFGDFHSTPFASCGRLAFMTQNDPSDLYRVDLVTGIANTLASEWTTSTNAIGYNILNDYIFGYDVSTPGHITVIDGSYNITSLDVQGLGNVNAYVGDVSTDGYLYLHDGNKTAWVVDVNPQRTTYLTYIKYIRFSRTSIADWAFNPADGKLYGINRVGRVIQVDPVTEAVHNLGNPGISNYGMFGAVHFDDEGYLYASHNNTGKIYRIDLRPPIQSPPTATLFTKGPSSNRNDGARCPYAPSALLDFGDAPESYGVLLNDNGPRHIIDPDLSLGVPNIDDERNGIPSANADGDDLDNVDDENGLNGGFPPLSSSATTYSVQIDVQNDTGDTAYLYGYLDWNKDGDFDDANERSDQVVVNSSGAYTVQWTVPARPTQNSTFARFRIGSNDDEVNTPYGPASDGEVEDYPVPKLFTLNALTIKKTATPDDGTQFIFQQDVDNTGDFHLGNGDSKQFTDVPSGDYVITETVSLGWQLDSITCDTQNYSVSSETLTVTLDENEDVTCTYTNSRKASDFGDAPDVNGQTSGNNRAFHVIDANGPYLGATPPDAEATGSPNTNADGDDNAGSNDEDGLSGFVGVDTDWSDGGAIEVDVSNVGNDGACVYAWVDWEDDGFGVGDDSTSQVEVSSAGTVTVNFNNDLPSKGNFPDSAYLRLRVVSGACSSLAATGGASDGEVEDFLLNFTPTAITLQAFDAASTPSIWLGGTLLAGLGLLGGVLALRKS